MERTSLSYKEQEQGSSLIEKGYDFYKDIQFIEGQPNKKSGLNSSKIKMISEWVSPVIKYLQSNFDILMIYWFLLFIDRTEELAGYKFGMPIKTVFDPSEGLYGQLQLPTTMGNG